jgi:hypothetical protein
MKAGRRNDGSGNPRQYIGGNRGSGRRAQGRLTGKAKSARNRFNGAIRPILRQLARELRVQETPGP